MNGFAVWAYKGDTTSIIHIRRSADGKRIVYSQKHEGVKHIHPIFYFSAAIESSTNGPLSNQQDTNDQFDYAMSGI